MWLQLASSSAWPQLADWATRVCDPNLAWVWMAVLHPVGFVFGQAFHWVRRTMGLSYGSGDCITQGPYFGIFQCLGHVSHTVFLYIARMMHKIFCVSPRVSDDHHLFEPPGCKTPTSPPRSPNGCCLSAMRMRPRRVVRWPRNSQVLQPLTSMRTYGARTCNAMLGPCDPLTVGAGIPWDNHSSIFALFITDAPVKICIGFGHGNNNHKQKTQGTQHASWLLSAMRSNCSVPNTLVASHMNRSIQSSDKTRLSFSTVTSNSNSLLMCSPFGHLLVFYF